MNHLRPPDERLARPKVQSDTSAQRAPLERSPHPYSRRSNTLQQHGPNKLTPPASQNATSTESGTEADDEKGTILRGLPAPPIRTHKGLRGSTPRGLSPAVSPLPTPPATRNVSFAELARAGDAKDALAEQRKQEAYRQRKKAEVVRRVTETILLAVIVSLEWLTANQSHRQYASVVSITSFLSIPPVLYGLFPVLRALQQYQAGTAPVEALRRGYHVPSRFDPGPLLYPVILPFAITLVLAGQDAGCLLTSIVCGLSSFPDALFDVLGKCSSSFYVRWILTVIPLLSTIPDHSMSTTKSSLTEEMVVLLFPLHRSLRQALSYLTTTSLDPAELDLLSTGLIHLLLFASSPQARILKSVLWIGGLSVFVFCRRFMEWEVELARIPRWKFAKVPHKSAISHRLTRAFSAFMSEPVPTSESSDDEIDQRAKPQPKSLQRVKTLVDPISALRSVTNGIKPPQRRATISDLDPMTIKVERRAHRHRQVQTSPFLALTLQQAKIRKYLYAAIVYVLVVLIIMGPVRYYVQVTALNGNEPFCWAAGYLFGNIPKFREWVYWLRLIDWIPLPERMTTDDGSFASLSDAIILISQPTNTRLALAAYCVLVVGTSLIVVTNLAPYVEVDTRRKVFHGAMSAMLLPTIFVDPCFFALALIIVLAVFLLLDLFRASQLPPISRPLTTFLAPYADGRDHRGPVIVSHIFLLIGCAIPLWLSLAGVERTGQDPWQGWEVERRDISMVAGVVCVGMGDAAASLIGRRYGRTKWYWGGGKSLEGSLAFAIAVVVGLSFAWLWLRVGGWVKWSEAAPEMLLALIKCTVAACGASLLESVLTAANDNVVVPVVLWVLVRALRI
jgi:dolichol kinase